MTEEGLQHLVPHFFGNVGHHRCLTQELLHRSHTTIDDATRRNPFKALQVYIHVKSKAVHRYTVAKVHADGAYFVSPTPDTGIASSTMSFD